MHLVVEVFLLWDGRGGGETKAMQGFQGFIQIITGDCSKCTTDVYGVHT